MNEDKESDCVSHKDLLYSEILNTSATGHVRDLFEKKQKSCTYHIERSTVLAKASSFLKSLDKVDENVQNIEDVEEGQPVIDMNVTLIPQADDSEYDSELDLNDEDSGDETEDDESITSSDSDKEALEDMKVNYGLCDKLVHKIFVTNNELSQNGSDDISSKNDCMLNHSKSKYPESKEQEGILLNKKILSCAGSDCKQSYSGVNNQNLCVSSDSSNEQFESDNKEVKKVKKSAVCSVKSNRLSEQESETQNRNFLEFSKPDFVLLNGDISDSSCKHESSIQKLDGLRSRKRELIAVIEDDDSSNLRLAKAQKIV